MRVREGKQSVADVVRIWFQPCGWLIAFFDEAYGSVSIQSDWGNVGYSWGANNTGINGPDKIKRFFATAGVDYIIDKFSYDQKDLKGVIDSEKTRAYFRDCIIGNRREDWWSKDKAREAWETADDFCDELKEKADGLRDCNGIDSYDSLYEHFDDAYEYICTRKSPMHVSFEEIVIPTLQRWLVDQGHRP